jgi:DNA-binding transcriptional LysR family regulator
MEGVMELRHLRYFVAVAEELNFTRAAARLHIAQPPLSTQIRALEGELGADLFLREKRRVYLTQAGEELLARARLILGAAHEAGVAVRNAASGIIGRVTLGYVASAMFSDRLPAVIRRFQRSHRHVELILVEKTSLDQIAALHERRMDVGVLRKPDLLLPESVAVEEWHQSLLIAAIPKDHELAKLDGVRIGDLRDQPIITYPRDAGIGLYWPFLQLCAKAGFQPNVVKEAQESSLIVGLVAAGVGIAVVPATTRCIALPGVAYRRIKGRDAHSTLYLARRKNDTSLHAKELLRALRLRRISSASGD